MQRYLLGATLQENFTHVQSSTTAHLDSARRTAASAEQSDTPE